MITLYLNWAAPEGISGRVDDAAEQRLMAVLRGVPGVTRGLVFTPAVAHDPYLNDGPPPPLAVQLYFQDIEALEAACAGPLLALADPGLLPGLAGSAVTQQAMLARSYPVATPAALPDPYCTYLVAYPGPAEDLNAWLTHYIASHPKIMARFPGIREIEITTRLDWCSALPFRRVDYMQRNKSVFDSQEALDAALNSPVRHEMRDDFHRFPPFTGGNTHYPMRTREAVPRMGGLDRSGQAARGDGGIVTTM